jgi:putative aldouronate transport system substrate-binding protein
MMVLLLLVAATVWSTGESEGAPADGRSIEFLTTGYHDATDEVRQAFVDAYRSLTGVDLVYRTVSSKDAGEAMTTQFMAGEFPDVVKYGGQSMNTLARQGFVIPLNEYIDSSPMNDLQRAYPTAFAAHSVGEEVYGIPEVVGAGRALWVRTDVLDALGLSMPTTLDELVNTLREIRDSYTNPDGSRMTSPYISKTYHTGYVSGLSNYFDVRMEPVVRRPGQDKFREGWDSPQFREYADFLKLLYDEGLIDPEHVLPQKASGTRSKFFSGQGAFIMMHAHLYQGLITGLRESFPDATIEMVPPIENPDGGVLGLSVIPGYRPYAITSGAEDPQFVWDEFVEPIYFDPEVSMLFYRGIPDVSYRVEDGVMIDNSDASGVGLGLRTPLNPDIEFPYEMSPLLERGVEIETQFGRWFASHEEYVVADTPIVVVPEYDAIAEDMHEKMEELIWRYVLGDYGFDEMMEQYAAYKQEIDFDAILRKINDVH